MPHAPTEATGYMPRFPHLTALAWTTAFVLLLAAPVFAGQFLVGPHSDQFIAGYAFRNFWTEQVRAHGSVPQWNPYIFGGLPYIGAMHGDLLYPFSWVRLVVPTDIAMSLTFVVHLVLAGFFAFLFLRALGLSWTAAVVGALAYQLTGQVASLVHPGHDGKLYVSAMLPLACWGLTRWFRDGRWLGAAVLGLATGLAILSPSFQMAYYLLLAAGLFALYLAFLDPARPASRRVAVGRLGVAAGAVALGFGLAAVQLWPFFAYLPFSPRSVAGASSGWAYATSWSMPPEELLNVVLPRFSGAVETYWGRNPIKLHSEYLGAVPLMLATLGLLRSPQPRLARAFAVIAGLFLLVSLGGYTPFYRLVYELLPMMKKVRAPSMAFYIVSFAVAVWAALGVERVSGAGKEDRLTAIRIWVVALAAIVVLALVGAWTQLGRGIADPARVGLLLESRSTVLLGATRVLVLGVAAAGVLLAWRTGRIGGRVAALALPLVVGLDLGLEVRRYFVFSPPAGESFAPDDITRHLAAVPKPFRVINAGGVYPGSILMAYDVADALGYHGNEIRHYDDLLGGKNEWRNLPNPQLWRLLAVRFIVYPDSGPIPGFHRVVGPVTTTPGMRAYLLEADSTPPYAHVATAALKLDERAIVPTLLDPRLPDFDRLVIYDPSQPVGPPALSEIPPPSGISATVADWAPGRIAVTLEPPPAERAYLLVSENWYPDWQATVDGRPARVLRGNESLITVPLAPGAQRVELTFHSAAFERGRLVTGVAALGLVALVAVPTAWRRRRA